MSIFTQLPNNLIMDIIKIWDGGLTTHKGKFFECCEAIREVGKMCIYEPSQSYNGSDWSDYPSGVDEFFSCLFQNDDMKETIIQHRRYYSRPEAAA